MEFVKVAEDTRHVLRLGPDKQPIPKTDPATGEELEEEFETDAVRSPAGVEVWESTGDVADLKGAAEALEAAFELAGDRDVLAIDIVIGGRVSIRLAYEDEVDE